MTPNARLKSTIELIEQIQVNVKKPADVIMQNYFKSRRFIGGGDRRAIGDMAFAILSHYHGLSHALNSDDARLLTFFYLQQHEHYNLVTIESLCDGEYAPKPLSNFEKKCLIKHAPYDKNLLPDWVSGYIPEGLIPCVFQQAPVDVRVNTLKN